MSHRDEHVSLAHRAALHAGWAKLAGPGEMQAEFRRLAELAWGQPKWSISWLNCHQEYWWWLCGLDRVDGATVDGWRRKLFEEAVKEFRAEKQAPAIAAAERLTAEQAARIKEATRDEKTR